MTFSFRTRSFLDRLDGMLDAIGSVSIVGDVEEERADTTKEERRSSIGGEAQASSSGSVLGRFRAGRSKAEEKTDSTRMVRRGRLRVLRPPDHRRCPGLG